MNQFKMILVLSIVLLIAGLVGAASSTAFGWWGWLVAGPTAFFIGSGGGYWSAEWQNQK